MHMAIKVLLIKALNGMPNEILLKPLVMWAWGYTGLRIVHSTIHCTSNVVMHRFYAYALSSLVLGIMIVRAAIEAVG